YNNGGAICIENSAPLIIGNVLMDNYAFSGPSGYGGAIWLWQSSAVICGNLITGNDAENGSALFLSSDSSLITNNLIVHNPNTYFDPRGTIYCDYGCETVFINNTIADNAEEAFYGDGTQMIIANCIIWGNGPVEIQGSFNVSYSDIQGGYPGTENINDTPCFIPGTLSNYHLNPDSSACIDAGNPASEFNDPEDPSNPGFALWPALGDLHNDMGAYGGSGVCYWVSIEEENTQVENVAISMHLSPNPFTSSLSIGYRLLEPGEVRLCLYDLSGREIAVLVSDFLAPGNHGITWNPDSRMPDGCYFIVLHVCEERVVRTAVRLP
ncbi:MAG: right-handed parallel beta-helix repeat-containing protein, partial [Candidatus Sabulitectum sp.]|nr:right-handed parallel beta-helix repeat-containing protein [Candidatus Sabulitectum sp.]